MLCQVHRFPGVLGTRDKMYFTIHCFIGESQIIGFVKVRHRVLFILFIVKSKMHLLKIFQQLVGWYVGRLKMFQQLVGWYV